jgi:hypothetical protein
MQVSQQVSKHKILHRASFRQRLGAGCVLLIVVGLFGTFRLAATDKFDMGVWFGPCGFKQEYGLPCPTCGMTTSALAFVRGNILEAFYIQPTAGLMCCVLAVTAVFAFLAAVPGVYFGFLERFFAEVKVRHIIVALIAIIAAGWAVTLARGLAAK